MASEKPARYESRQIIDWLRMVDSGEVALPSFQRSYVWKNQRIADYLTALFQNRPTGTFIILSTDAENDPVFVSRAIDGTSADRDRTRELILDGQQRLTALWRALTGQGSHRFFAVVKDITSRDMTVQNVVFHAKSSAMREESTAGQGWLPRRISFRSTFSTMGESMKRIRTTQGHSGGGAKQHVEAQSESKSTVRARRLEAAARTSASQQGVALLCGS